MSDKSYQYYFLKIWLQSIGQPMVFPVAEAAWGRFKQALQTKRKGFFIFATRDGRTLALNLKYVQLTHFLWEEQTDIKEEVDRAGYSGLTLYFPDRDPEFFQIGDPVDLAKIFSALKHSVEREALTFTDTTGKMTMFFMEEMILLETSTVFVEKGFTTIFYQERGSLPPR